jgi:hypothetical protein
MEITNPRFFPGNISGLGLQKEETGRAVDTRYGVHPDLTDGCLIEHPLQGDITIAYAMDGLLEGTTDRVRALYLLSLPFTVHVITELTSMLLRADPSAATALVGRLTDAVNPPPLPVEPETEQPVPASPTDTLVMPVTEQDEDWAAA